MILCLNMQSTNCVNRRKKTTKTVLPLCELQAQCNNWLGIWSNTELSELQRNDKDIGQCFEWFKKCHSQMSAEILPQGSWVKALRNQQMNLGP